MKSGFYIFLTLVFFLSGQMINEQDTCSIEFKKEDFSKNKIELQCKSFNNGEHFSINGFSIKFPGHPTVVVKNSFHIKIQEYSKLARAGDVVVIFDIQKAFDSKDQLISKDKIPPFHIKILK